MAEATMVPHSAQMVVKPPQEQSSVSRKRMLPHLGQPVAVKLEVNPPNESSWMLTSDTLGVGAMSGVAIMLQLSVVDGSILIYIILQNCKKVNASTNI